MADALIFLTSITFVLLAGIICTSLSKRLKLPLSLLLFLSGVILGNIFYFGRPLAQFGAEFLAAFSIIALLVVLFDSVSRIKFHEIPEMKEGFYLFIATLLLNLLVISFISRLFFNLDQFASIVFALLISCVEFTMIYPRHHEPRNKVSELLQNESLVSCAFIILIPFLIIYFLKVFAPYQAGGFFAKFMPSIANIFAGIGAGLIIALIAFKLINKLSEKISSLILAIGVLLAYVLAQQIQGNGLIAVAAIAVIFGNVFLKHKNIIKSHENIAHQAVEVLALVLIGIIIGLPSNLAFYKYSIGLFLIYLILRLIAVGIVLRHYDKGEKLEIAFFVPKGIVTVAIAFALLNYSFTGVVLMTQLLLAFFVYSLVFDTVLDKPRFYRHR